MGSFSTVICTVGKSLLNRLRQLKNEGKIYFNCEEGGESIRKAVDFLLSLKDPRDDRTFGAEINSLASMVGKGIISPRQNLYLLVSGTRDGKIAGEILKGFFERAKDFGLNFNTVRVREIEGLVPNNPHTFRNEGIRNFILKVTDIIRKHRGHVVINATGGFKALMPFCILLGQCFDAPVYYRFEEFDEVMEITIPLWSLNADRLRPLLKPMLEVDCAGADGVPERSIKNYLDMEHADLVFETRGGRVFLSSVGQVLLELLVSEVRDEDLLRMVPKAETSKVVVPSSEAHLLQEINRHWKEKLERIRLLGFVRKVEIPGKEVSTKGGKNVGVGEVKGTSNGSASIVAVLYTKRIRFKVYFYLTCKNRRFVEIARRIIWEILEK